MSNRLSMNDIVVTLDVDWCPDFMMEFVAQELINQNVRATWFVTHDSPALSRLRTYPELFELGIHPNFHAGSSHGEAPEAVLDHCMKLVPDAVSMRTHDLFQSSSLLGTVLRRTPIATDVSLFLPGMLGLRPFQYRVRWGMLVRIPFFWEDDVEMEQLSPCWRLVPLLRAGDGLKVFNFHPVHVYLNSHDSGAYHTLKKRSSSLPEVSKDDADRLIYSGTGTRTLFLELLQHLAASGQSLCIKELHERAGKS